MTTIDSLDVDLPQKLMNITGVEPLISKAVVYMIRKVDFLFLTLPVSILGIFTNIANIVVFSKLGFSENSNLHFVALSICDFMGVTPLMITGALCYPAFKNFSNWPLMLHIGHSLTRVTIVAKGGSAMMTTVISAERCLAVMFPLKVTIRCSVQPAEVVVLGKS
ncbi:chemosensory receptor A [Elysia marginata]|uniref:Chemosensory receptor A n=1 Tax=Elysia marginata TaxID=1093978 RepID=A0AAV4GB10_9GAST|nr:chemosensory receptor A [Elysia marginata]